MRTDRKEPAPGEHEVLAHLLAQARAFLLRNGLHIALVVCLLLLAVVVAKTHALRRTTRTLKQWEAIGANPEIAAYLYGPENAAMALERAIQQCRAILAEEPETTATPWVLLKLANLYASGQQWVRARSTYQKLMDEYAGTAAAAAAAGGLAVALEELKDYGGAGDMYERLAENGPLRYLLDAGRSRELAGDAPGAEANYKRLLDSQASDRLRSLAEARLAELAQGRLLGPPPEMKRPEPVAQQPQFRTLEVGAETPVGPGLEAPAAQEAREETETR
ncbi:MAG: tetratricopeptide repeat protein [Planctomycetota bacterium]